MANISAALPIMGIEEVADIIHKIADGFEEACAQCLADNSDTVIYVITEQLYCGVDGDGNFLSPTYDDDPFFNEPGYWHNRSDDYKAWKYRITPPMNSATLSLPPRPDNVPNLCIDGTFYSEISARRQGMELMLDPGSGNGPAIVSKYGEQILELGTASVSYFNQEYMMPAIETFFESCGYQ